jgi:hypothetical protein
VEPELAATIGYLIPLVTALQPHLTGANGPTRRTIERAQELQQTALLDHITDPSTWADEMINATEGTITPAC